MKKPASITITALLLSLAAAGLLSLAGCEFRFLAEDLQILELHESTNISDWALDVFDRNTTIDFRKGNINGKNDPERSIKISEKVTGIVNEYGVHIGLFSTDGPCELPLAETGFIVLQYRTGTIIIEENPCEKGLSDFVYHEIEKAVRT